MGDTAVGICKECGLETDLILELCQECFLKTRDDIYPEGTE